ncbi:flagellar biosynthetic protein FliO [Afifella marina]|uniref:Flagellar biosynthesis protein, FliO n=1 Tax=Afifella marina DSM 2698 TaxID=1120955 RepID=A0A1G5N663_AFIMA|nr:flagellar biosynthetic protein FliO [Afifella marina]MBK1622547.1 hypothetical protein [Afifella marina DSM 2698]MBK1626738.1 hypothetical protein [Afifella marina]MBK5919332.1 hypothetical protein [Afifella marina]RAI21365.1 hypothetical protein CH311_07815 [Afifella marina DSM 2698]SCZ32866.1 Flagellar biosynthesis protein, FliO [Afifella marina DSM 2698]
MRGLTDLSTGAFAGPILIAIAVLLVILGLVVWITRRGIVPGRGAGAQRVSRLQVMETHAIDQKRRLLLIRRDQVEHLVMIGGPADIVVESQIVRGRPSAQPTPRRPGGPSVAPQMPGFPGSHRPPAPSSGEYPETSSASQPMGQNTLPPAEPRAPSPAIGRASAEGPGHAPGDSPERGPAHGAAQAAALAPNPAGSRTEAAEVAETEAEPVRTRRAVPEAYRFGMDEDDIPAPSSAEISARSGGGKAEPRQDASATKGRELRNPPAQSPSADASKEENKAALETPFGDMPLALRARMLSGLFSPAPKPGQPVPDETPAGQAPSNTLPFAKRPAPQQDKAPLSRAAVDQEAADPKPELVAAPQETAAIEKATVSFFQNIRRVSKEATEEVAPAKAETSKTETAETEPSKPDTRSLEEEIGEAFGEIAAQRSDATDARPGGADRSALNVPAALNEDKGEARTATAHMTWPTISMTGEKRSGAPLEAADAQSPRDERPQPTTIAEIASQLESALSEHVTARTEASEQVTAGAQPEGPGVSPAKPEAVSKVESDDEISVMAKVPEIHRDDAHGVEERLAPEAPAIAPAPFSSETGENQDQANDEEQRERRSTANLENDESASVVAFEPKRKWASEQEQLEDEMARLLGELTGDLKNR